MPLYASKILFFALQQLQDSAHAAETELLRDAQTQAVQRLRQLAGEYLAGLPEAAELPLVEGPTDAAESIERLTQYLVARVGRLKARQMPTAVLSLAVEHLAHASVLLGGRRLLEHQVEPGEVVDAEYTVTPDVPPIAAGPAPEATSDVKPTKPAARRQGGTRRKKSAKTESEGNDGEQRGACAGATTITDAAQPGRMDPGKDRVSQERDRTEGDG